MAFGTYEGGELCIGDRTYDLRHRPFTFHAATIPHSVRPITSGTRYSIVFYKTRFPQAFIDKYGDNLSYDELEALLPPTPPGTPASAIKIPY